MGKGSGKDKARGTHVNLPVGTCRKIFLFYLPCQGQGQEELGVSGSIFSPRPPNLAHWQKITMGFFFVVVVVNIHEGTEFQIF